LPCLTAVKPVTVEPAVCKCDRSHKLITTAKRHVRAACRCFTNLSSISVWRLVNFPHDVRQLRVGGYQQNIVPTTCLDISHTHIKPLHTLGIAQQTILTVKNVQILTLVSFILCVGGAHPGLVAADHHSAHILLHPAVPCAVHTAIRGSNDTGNGMRWYCQSSR